MIKPSFRITQNIQRSHNIFIENVSYTLCCNFAMSKMKSVKKSIKVITRSIKFSIVTHEQRTSCRSRIFMTSVGAGPKG